MRQRFSDLLKQADTTINGQMFIHSSTGGILPIRSHDLKNWQPPADPQRKNHDMYAMIGAHSQQDNI